MTSLSFAGIGPSSARQIQTFDFESVGALFGRRSEARLKVGPMSVPLRYCCKSRKLQRHEFFAKTRGGRRLLIRIPSIALPKSPVSLTRGDMSPHIFTPKTRLEPAEFLITCAKRLLQQYPSESDRPRRSI